MNLTNVSPVAISIFIMIALIPFSYLELVGLRIIVLSFFAFVVLFFCSFKGGMFVDNNLLLFVLPFLLVSIYSFVSGSKDHIAALVFMVYLLMFNFVGNDRIKQIFNKSLVIYVSGAVFMAIGTIAQRVLFEKFGYEIGKIDFYGGGRIGFGFIWLDYSFLSLYLLTALPMIFYLYESLSIRVLLSIVLLVGSVVTTARAGLAGLILTALLVFVIEFINILAKGKVNKRVLLTLCVLALASFLIVYFYVRFSIRDIRFDGSGRLEGYYMALQSFVDHPFLGVMFDREYFSLHYGVLPHNLFIYILSQGGIIFFIFFMVWFFYVLYVAFFKVQVLRYPILIAIFGLMFIPSFFSGYFYALLVSLAMAERRIFIRAGV